MDKKVCPTQDEVDSIASYVEAVTELQTEPFFSRDEPRSIAGSGDKFTYRLGDRFHFRSALITFRRIWMQGDPENFDHVCNLIWKYTTPPPNYFLMAIRKGVRAELDAQPKWPQPLPVSGRLLVDLWLNAVFAHSGLRGSKKLRHEFDALVERFGSGRLEFAFRHLVWSLGLQYQNLVQPAKNLVASWTEEFGIVPSFKLGSPFGRKRRERTTNGDLIIREGSSEFFSEESYEQRFVRILGRTDFSSLRAALEMLQFSDRELLPIVLKFDSYSAIVAESMLQLHLAPQTPGDVLLPEGFTHYIGLNDSRGRNASAIRLKNNEIITDAAGISVLDELLRKFKRTLFDSI
jgi:hypothetical protein